MNKRCLYVLVLGLFVIQLVMPNFDASKVTTENVNQTEVEYAPQNPTRKQVRTAQPTDIVKFDDINFEQDVANTLGSTVGNITVEDMGRLEQFYSVSAYGYQNLTGMEYAVNLSTLVISRGYITDITPLSNLVKLTDLEIRDNLLDDITPLANLKELENVRLDINNITDITPLKDLTKIKTLIIAANRISDLTPLSGLSNLEYLNIEFTKVTDLTPLSGVTSLTKIHAYYNEISDISAVSNLTNLQELDLNMNKITDISAVSSLTNLKKLALSGNQIEDISAVSSLTNLKYLSLNLNQIIDFSPIPVTNNLSANILNQTINLPAKTVNTDNEVIANIIGINGEKIPVSLGVPTLGKNKLTATKNLSITTPIIMEYSAEISQDVDYVEKAWKTEETINEGNIQTDEQLKTLFDISDGATPYTVDQSAVDYNKPGNYQITFVAGSKMIYTILTVVDVLPVITVTNPVVHIQVGDTSIDYISTFGINATEITDGDLTQSIIVDDSKVNYNQAGTYEVKFQITDDEGNNIEEKGDLVIGEDNGTIPNPLPETIPDGTIPDPLPEETISETASEETISETTSEETVTENVNNESSNVKTKTDVENTKTTDDGSDTTTNDSEEASNTKDSTNAMTAGENKVLASTGNKTAFIILTLSLFVGLLVSLRSSKLIKD